MGDFIGAMGMMSIPLIVCSFVAIAAIVSLFLTLKKDKVIPEGIAETAQKLARSGKTTRAHIEKIREGSMLGRVLATGLESMNQPRHVMKENIEESGRHVAHLMDRFMITLGTIATIAPLLGLLGTVVGMIEVFGVITDQGVGNARELAPGIKTALYTTAVGIVIAVIALVFHRYFRGKITNYAIEMEKAAIKLLSAAPAPKPAARRPASSAAAKKREPLQTAGQVA